jgi:hypothetical protein
VLLSSQEVSSREETFVFLLTDQLTKIKKPSASEAFGYTSFALECLHKLTQPLIAASRSQIHKCQPPANVCLSHSGTARPVVKSSSKD